MVKRRALPALVCRVHHRPGNLRLRSLVLYRLERIQLMFERSFATPPLCFVTEVVQDKGIKTHGVASTIVASCAESAEDVIYLL